MQPVIVAVDFSDPSRAAVDQAAALCRRLGGDLVLLYAANLAGAQPDAYEVSRGQLEPFRELLVEEIEGARARLQAWAGELTDRGLEARALVVDGPAVRAIDTVAAREGARLVVLGTHGRVGYERIALGSVAERVVRTCPVDVLVARPPVRPEGFTRIFAATDFSPAADRALELAVELAAPEARVQLVHAWRIAGVVGDFLGRIVQSSTYAHVADAVIHSAESRGRERVERVERVERGRVRVEFSSYGGTAAGVIHDRIDAADPPYDLVCVGSHGPGDDAAHVGSVSQAVARFATCSVLVARPPA